ncbi:aryl-sulfate sulfotransferase [uncultured Clostridium sp.]|uniref:aryl-sulfate sulfotransferase n=1 Tax=uncultured Clostridium sp. TaxID=59620 RepID=UPI0025E7C9C9|nr:aryl-sulfate sulfotransferase [uncultured Clostridium sp.]
MCGNNVAERNNKSRAVNDEEITLYNMNYDKESNIYNMEYQKKLYDEVSAAKKSGNFTIENPLVICNNLVYISVDINKIASLDRLGYVKDVYDLGKYEMHHDYILGDDGNLLILLTDTESDSSEDKVISLNLKDGSIEEIIDFGLLFADIKEKAVLPEGKDKLDWIHVNALSLLNDKTVLFSSRELSTIINISDIYDNPSVNYLIADEKIWDDTHYADIVYSKDGSFQIHGGQHSIDVITDDWLIDYLI